jgi:ATP-dependent helicase Lhr and Lhr-like helicase
MSHSFGQRALPADIDAILDPTIKQWFYQSFKTYSDAQLFSFFPILSRNHTLVCAPTGTGKTLSAFLSILHDLHINPHQGIHTLYISPLKSLNFDIARNLLEPLTQMRSTITVGIRVGDTTPAQRAAQKKHPPNILVTTPESLALLLTSSFASHFSQLKYVIIDEIHHVLSSKRGAHLSLLLESLRVRSPHITRIGLSATLANPQLGASYLAGTNATAVICEVQSAKALDLRCQSVGSFIDDSYQTIAQNRLSSIHSFIQSHKSTLIFCNTRQLSERVVADLKEAYPQDYYEINEEPPFEKSQLIGAHHSSLSFEIRSEMEQKLKAGKMKAICTSSSLELGIDIGYVDLVIQIGSPKSVTRLLQRIGRAGHKLGATSTGVLFALDALDEIECVAICELAKIKQLEPLDCIHPAFDICMQWILGEVLLESKSLSYLYQTLKQSFVYRSVTIEQFSQCIDLLRLEQSSVGLYPKITVTNEQVSSRISPFVFYQNSGSIVESGSIRVVCGHQLIGTVEEDFAQSLKPSDVFILGAQSYRFIRLTGMTLFVQLIEGRTNTIPRWRSDALSLSYESITSFSQPGVSEAIRLLPLFKAQELVLATTQQDIKLFGTDILVERFFDANMHYVFFHTPFGRKVNEALCTLFLFATKKQGSSISYGVFDFGFFLCSTYELSFQSIAHRIGLGKARVVLDIALEETEHIKRRFRGVSTRSFSILRRYKQSQKTVGQLQMKSQFLYYTLRSQNPVLFSEAKQEVLSVIMDISHAQQIIDDLIKGSRRFIEIHTTVPTPFSACMLALSLDMLSIEHKQAYVVRAVRLGLKPNPQESRVFSYTSFWNEEETRVKQDFVSQAHFIARKLQLDSAISHELLSFCDSSHRGPYSPEFLSWLHTLLSGAIPRIWSDELILFLKEKLQEYL